MIAASLVCPDCGSDMVLRESRYGKFYGCVAFPACRGAHGAHPDGSPLGTPAPKNVREARVRLHKTLDALWLPHGRKARTLVYKRLAEDMGIKESLCHAAYFDEQQCEQALAKIKAWNAESKR